MSWWSTTKVFFTVDAEQEKCAWGVSLQDAGADMYVSSNGSWTALSWRIKRSWISVHGCTVSWTCINELCTLTGCLDFDQAEVLRLLREGVCIWTKSSLFRLHTHCIWRYPQQSGNERRHNKMWWVAEHVDTDSGYNLYCGCVVCVYRLFESLPLLHRETPAPSVWRRFVCGK